MSMSLNSGVRIMGIGLEREYLISIFLGQQSVSLIPAEGLVANDRDEWPVKVTRRQQAYMKKVLSLHDLK